MTLRSSISCTLSLIPLLSHLTSPTLPLSLHYMPRKKTYTTKEARCKADRLKAARHYAKTRIQLTRSEESRDNNNWSLNGTWIFAILYESSLSISSRQQNLSKARTELEKHTIEQQEQRRGSTWQRCATHTFYSKYTNLINTPIAIRFIVSVNWLSLSAI